eukprot:TRINITY_DN38041_c0_g1_i2.p1 TRINITY_DN38041_c0_g1~~TRINITY_DN38041_c0_g1_i2.p1  ORF type:complete len:456 (-),score=7.52 TRINITY_DN38041_c0_g1_i2:355-1722(-)
MSQPADLLVLFAAVIVTCTTNTSTPTPTPTLSPTFDWDNDTIGLLTGADTATDSPKNGNASTYGGDQDLTWVWIVIGILFFLFFLLLLLLLICCLCSRRTRNTNVAPAATSDRDPRLEVNSKGASVLHNESAYFFGDVVHESPLVIIYRGTYHDTGQTVCLRELIPPTVDLGHHNHHPHPLQPPSSSSSHHSTTVATTGYPQLLSIEEGFRQLRQGGSGHPCVVEYLAVFERTDLHRIVLVTEWVNTENDNVINTTESLGAEISRWADEGGVPALHVAVWTKQILLALQHLHTAGLIHGDLNPQNVLLTSDQCAKLTNYSQHLLTYEQLIGNKVVLTKVTTTAPMYMAPEVVNSTNPQHPTTTTSEIRAASDVWSLGILVLEMLTATWPWKFTPGIKGKDSNEVLHLLGSGVLFPHLPSNIDQKAEDFLGMCLQTHPQERATVHQLLNHPWLVVV